MSARLLLLLAWLTLGPLVRAQDEAPEAPAHPNVLFVSFDDMNDWIGPLGGLGDAPKTPNLERLARMGATFVSAHCTAPACNPSRVSVLTGLRPTTSGVYENDSDWRAALPGVVTLPMLFRQNGYEMLGLGKTFHSDDQDAEAWDQYAAPPNALRYVEHLRVGKLAWAGIEGAEEKMPDHQMALLAAQALRARHVKPFFLAIGFKKPHLPWIVPKQYFERYDPETIPLPAVREHDLDDVPEAGRAMVHATSADHAKVLEAKAWPVLVHAYLAAISFADAQLGIVLDALEEGPNAANTVICVWSDHGFHVGEKEHWRKFTLWEDGTRVPFFVVAPGVTRGGERIERPVDLVHVLPSLADLCGLSVDPALRERWDGQSLRPLLVDPAAPWEHPALTTYRRGNHAVRTERWRYIRYADGSEELYDHAVDPDEWTNLAGDPETQALRARLAGWLPPTEAAPAPLEPPRGGKGAKARDDD